MKFYLPLFFLLIVSLLAANESVIDFTILSSAENQTGDNLCDAQVLVLNETCSNDPYSNNGTTTEQNESFPSGCADDFTNVGTSWYKVEIPIEDNYRMGISSSFNSTNKFNIVIYRANENFDCATYEGLQLVARICFESRVGPSISGNRLAGTYYLQVITENDLLQPFCMIAEKECPFVEDVEYDSGVYTATSECTDNSGETFYYDTDQSGMLRKLLIIKKNGNDIGTVGDGTFDLTVNTAGGVSLIPNTATNYVTNPSGWYTMNYHWTVTPTHEPTSDVEVEFVLKPEHFSDLQDAIVDAGGNAPADTENIFFYKINDINANYDINPQNGHQNIPFAAAYDADGYWQYFNLGNNDNAPSSDEFHSETLFRNFMLEKYTIGIKVAHFGGGGGGVGVDGGGAAPATSLPLELLSFSGKISKNGNLIQWTTTTEKNNTHYQLQRSTNGKNNWNVISKSTTALHSSPLQKYEILDANPIPAAYYRLQIKESDGKITYSKVLFLESTPQEEVGLRLLHNPVHQTAEFIYELPTAVQRSEIIITNLLGQVVKKVAVPDGTTGMLSISLTDTQTGAYNCTLLVNNQAIDTERLILVK